MGLTPVWRLPGMRDLAIVSLAGFSGYAVLLSVAPLWAVRDGAGATGAGFVNGVLLASTVATQLTVPRALARFGWPTVLSIGMALLGVPALLLPIRDDFWAVLVVSAVRGVGFGVLTVTGSSAVARLIEPARRGEAIGLYGLTVALPNMLLIPLGPWVAERVGYWLASIIGALPLLGIVAACRLARAVVSTQLTADKAPYTDPLPPIESLRLVRRRLFRPMLLLLSVTLTGGALITFVPQMVTDAWLAPAALFTFGFLAALARWRAGIVADHWGAERLLPPLLVLASVGTALIAWSISSSSGTLAWALIAGISVVGIGYGGLQNLTLVVSFNAVSQRRHDLASATWNAGFDAGTGLGSILTGVVAGVTSFTSALLVVAAVAIAALPLAWLRPDRPAGHSPV